jgi:hypothetical protein
VVTRRNHEGSRQALEQFSQRALPSKCGTFMGHWRHDALHSANVKSSDTGETVDNFQVEKRRAGWFPLFPRMSHFLYCCTSPSTSIPSQKLAITKASLHPFKGLYKRLFVISNPPSSLLYADEPQEPRPWRTVLRVVYDGKRFIQRLSDAQPVAPNTVRLLVMAWWSW